MNKALPIILAILISAAVFGGVGYYLGTQKAEKTATTATVTTTTTAKASGTVTADVTANWKTYTNETYGFSFKYPSDWNVKDVASGNKDIPGLKALYGTAPATVTQDSLAFIKVTSQTKDETIAYQKSILSTNQELISTEMVNKFGSNVTKLTVRNKTTGIDSYQYIFSNTSSSNVFVVTGSSNATGANEQQANDLINTFQFTE